MAALISVVVVNWNGLAYLPRCLEALAAQTYPQFEIILVDNGSIDGSAAWVPEHHPSVRLITNSENRGFAAGNNQGIRAARGDYIALLNNDAWPEPAWLAALAAAMDADARVGMVASKMVFAHRPDVINSTGICVDRGGISWDRDGGQLDDASTHGVAWVFGPCAGAALYRRAMLDQVGLFDEGFFAYLEDVDLAWRARWQGWEAVCAPAARVHHVHSATSGEGSTFKIYWLSRNKINLLVKNYPTPALWLYLPLIVAYETLSFGNGVVRGVGLPAARGRWAALRQLPELLRQRRRLMAAARVPAQAVLAALEPAAWPWRVAARVAHLDALPDPFPETKEEL